MSEEQNKEELEKLLKNMDDVLGDAAEIANNADIDGFRILEYKADGVYLTIHPPQGFGQPLGESVVLKELGEKKITGLDTTVVKQTLIEMTGLPVLIAPPQKEIVEDGYVRLEVTNDFMKAYLTVYPPMGGKQVSIEEIKEKLSNEGIVFGIKEEMIYKAIELQNVSEPVLIAEGKEVLDGQDAILDYKFGINNMAGKPTEMEDGRVDYYNLNLINNVQEGDVLATKTPPTPGQDGMTVNGTAIPAKAGKDIMLAVGKNAEIIDDGTTVIASTQGHVLLQGNKITVSPVLEVNGDVDFSSGNIEFVGSIIVKGAVKEGFSVKAHGDVEIKDHINAAYVEASGSIKVQNGIQGQNKGKIVAGKDIIAKYIENAKVSAGGNILIGEGIMHSEVNARGIIEVGGKKGVIVGGVVRAGDDIKAKIFGSNYATATEIEVGVNPELRTEFDDLSQNLINKESDLDKAQKAVKLLKQIQEQTGNLPDDKKAMLVKLTRTQFHLMGEVEAIKQKKNEIEAVLEETERGRVMASGVIHPGVKVSIGKAAFFVRDELQFACLTRDGDQIKVSPYK